MDLGAEGLGKGRGLHRPEEIGEIQVVWLPAYLFQVESRD
jgi:hypothetical protein